VKKPFAATTWAPLLAVATLYLAACTERASDIVEHKQHIEWSVVAGQKILFAHQSVGANILEGVKRLAKRDGAAINVNELSGGRLEPGFTHFKIGRNGEPILKLAEFKALFEERGTQGADVALVRLCYIDFTARTDARFLAAEYSRTLDLLAERYPSTRFIAVTAPLMTVQTGPKAWVKKLIGRQPAQYVENAKRAEFNEIIRSHFAAPGRLFDLAKIEAEAGRQRSVVIVNGREVETLDPSLTNDGGHLNEVGQDVVASALLRHISGISLP
jgi:lysophospholipase L1-like esterase